MSHCSQDEIHKPTEPCRVGPLPAITPASSPLDLLSALPRWLSLSFMDLLISLLTQGMSSLGCFHLEAARHHLIWLIPTHSSVSAQTSPVQEVSDGTSSSALAPSNKLPQFSYISSSQCVIIHVRVCLCVIDLHCFSRCLKWGLVWLGSQIYSQYLTVPGSV